MSSKRGRVMAERMADYVQAHTEIGKAFGTRESLAGSLSVHGEFLAAVEQEKRRTIKANDKLLKNAKRADELGERALEMFQRAMDADKLALSKVEAYALPSESEISQRVNSMIQRRMDSVPKVLARIDRALELN
jgi:hypothetical protein